ncbi:hypothetical protein B0I35DRAFT_430829 [Stachybotrys elegans]|uniref:Uncharacterized protein n=1 Tax=Stachybotrys elegans TaxID=80388 RepID=A0A8K0WRI8_9HYPO|nr:hypothetical protein B0I35DRAFT_430829 [Stachybotrys elegans]
MTINKRDWISLFGARNLPWLAGWLDKHQLTYFETSRFNSVWAGDGLLITYIHTSRTCSCESWPTVTRPTDLHHPLFVLPLGICLLFLEHPYLMYPYCALFPLAGLASHELHAHSN